MGMSKKKTKSQEELLKEALVPVEEQPYEVPVNWSWVRLSAVFEQVTKQVQPSGVEKYIGLEHLLKGGGYLGSGLSDELKSKKVAFKVGDVLYGKLRPYLNKHAIVDFDGVASTDILIYRSPNVNLAKLLNLYLGLPHVIGYANENSNGINLPRVSPRAMANLSFPLPPLNEQKRIADKVERLLGKINQAKQLIEEAKETFELRRAAILDKAFRGELTKKWRTDNQDKLINGTELYELIKSDRFENVESNRELKELVQLFESFSLQESIDANGWVHLKANMFCININCGRTPSNDLSDSGEVPFLKVYNIVNNKIDFEYKPQFIPKKVSDSALGKSKLLPNDVIMNIVGPPLKKIAIIPEDYPEWSMNQAIVRFRPLKYVLPKYLFYCLQFDETLREVINDTRGVVGQSNISVSQSRNLSMPIPSIDEQHEIVYMLEQLIQKESTVLDILKAKKDELELLTQSILAKAFTGSLGTGDAAEEPAISLSISSN